MTLPEIIIRPLDEEGAILVMNKSDYINGLEGSFYKRVDGDTIEQINTTVKETLGTLSQETIKQLKRKHHCPIMSRGRSVLPTAQNSEKG